jgi:hypothetical protein
MSQFSGDGSDAEDVSPDGQVVSVKDIFCYI